MDIVDSGNFIHYIEILLKQIALLEKEKLLSEKKAGYNVISLIRDETDEVNLHSKILHDLLNPEGRHQLGDLPLKHFLNELELDEFVCKNVSVYREYKNIDILITNGNQAIIIENKIGAGDQERQLERYWRTIQSEGIYDIKVLYLTVNNHSPSENSLGELTEDERKFVFNLSYGDKIRTWLKKCYASAIDLPELRESLKQYIHIVNHISGRVRTMELSNEIAEILSINDNLKYALAIADSIPVAQARIQEGIWEKIEETARERGLTLGKHTHKRWDEENLLIGYHRGDRGNHWYGTTFHVAQISEDVFVEYRLEVSHILYHGFLAVRRDGRFIEIGDPDRTDLELHTQQINNSFHTNRWWLGYLKHSPLNYTTLRMEGEDNIASQENLNKYISQLFDIIMPNIEGMRELIARE